MILSQIRDSHFKIGNISISSLRIHERYTINIIMFSNYRKFLAIYVSSKSGRTKNFHLKIPCGCVY